MNSSILWVDTFLFNGDEICFARLAYLYPYVDKFYICEKTHTYQGHKKEVLFIDSMKDRFTPYLEKIVFLVDDSPIVEDSWKNETTHRNFVVPRILTDYADKKYIVTVCDCDEIPDAGIILMHKDKLYNDTSRGAIYMKQDMYYYNLQWFMCEWTRAYILNDTLLKSIQSFQLFRDFKAPVQGVIPSGWHLSYFMTVDQIVTKIESFSHTELNTDDYKNREFITHCIHNGHDYAKRADVRFVKRSVDVNQFPPEIIQFHCDIVKRQV